VQRYAAGDLAFELTPGDELPEKLVAWMLANRAQGLQNQIACGQVVRLDADGQADPRSRRFLPRAGLTPWKSPIRQINEARDERRLRQTVRLENGQQILAIAGQPDGISGDLVVIDGKAYGVRRGQPDAGSMEAKAKKKAGQKKRPKKKAQTTARRRRRRRAATG